MADPDNNIQQDIIAILSSESEINSVLALLQLAWEASGYNSAILVISDSSQALIQQLRSRIEKQCPQLVSTCQVTDIPPDRDRILSLLKEDTALRLVLIPGLDHLTDLQRSLLKELDVSVVCFQNHQSLQSNEARDCLIEQDPWGTVDSFRDLLGHERPWRHRALSDVLDEAQQQAKKKSESNGEPPVDDTDSRPSMVADQRCWYFLATDVEQLESGLKKARQLMEQVAGPVLLIRAEKGWSRRAIRSRWLRRIVRHIPQMDREQRKQLADQLEAESKPSFDFLALICASSFLAAFGLAQNSAAVIIGAMLVAPLMSPILAAGLALAQGNRVLFTRSLKTIGLGFVSALMAGALFGTLLQVVPNTILEQSENGYRLTSEMWNRTYPGSLDFLVGLVGGSAAAFARTRKELSSALAGAAIAAALVPPIATAGIELSFLLQAIEPLEGRPLENLVLGPSLLFLCNMLTIMIGSSFVLWACGTRGVHDHSSKERWTVRMIALLALFTVLVFIWIVQH